jgi:hypothetical protein
MGGGTDLVHGLGEAIEIVDGAADDVDRRRGRLPVAGHDEDGARSVVVARDPRGQPRLEEVPRRDRIVDGERGRAVRQVEGIHGLRAAWDRCCRRLLGAGGGCVWPRGREIEVVALLLLLPRRVWYRFGRFGLDLPHHPLATTRSYLARAAFGGGGRAVRARRAWARLLESSVFIK